MKKRKNWIDILRALAMFFVVLGHLLPGKTLYHVITAPIKMPLFYILTGYLIEDKKNIKDFVFNLLFRLLIPWVLLSSFPAFVLRYLVQGQYVELVTYIVKFLTGQAIWFIPSFIITQCFFYILLKISKKNNKLLSLYAIISFSLGIFLAKLGLAKIWCLNTALTGIFFMYLGHLYKNFETVIDKQNNKIIIFGLPIYVFFIFITLIFFPGKNLDFHMVKYYNIPICLISCVVGALVAIAIVKKIENFKILKPIIIFGQNTLIVYLLHDLILYALDILCSMIFSINNSLLYISLKAIITCIITTIISLICGHYIPWIVGKKKKEEFSLK